MGEIKFNNGDEVRVKGKNIVKPKNRLRVMLFDRDGIFLSQQKPNGRYEGWHGPYQPSHLEKIEPVAENVQQKLL